MRILLFTLIISMMSGIMFNIVLPKISEDFSLTISQVSWLSSAYILIYAIGNELGPVVAALIVSTVHWRWLFAVPLLILATLPFYRKYLGNEQPETTGKFDWTGGSLLAITIALLLLSVKILRQNSFEIKSTHSD